MDTHTRLDPTDGRNRHPRFSEENRAQNVQFVDALKRIADDKGVTSAQLALAWVLARKPWIVPIPGPRKISRLEENLASADVDLSEADLSQIDEALSGLEVAGERYDARGLAMVDR